MKWMSERDLHRWRGSASAILFGVSLCLAVTLNLSACGVDTEPGESGDGDGDGNEGDGDGDSVEPSSGGSDSGAGGEPGTGGDAPGAGGMDSVPEETSSPGCDSGTTLSDGEHVFQLEAKERTYIVRLPESYDGTTPLPLVLALHPNGSDAGYWDDETTEGPLNARDHLSDKAILVIAEAIGGNWRDYDTEEATWPARVEEELLYFDKVLDDAKSGLCIDESAIFSIGFSGGGSFSGVLGCRRSDIRAFAAGGSVIYFDPLDCVQAPPAWIAISEGDQSDLRTAFVDHFRTTANCSDESTAISPTGCVAYDACNADSPVVHCSHPGGHELPDYFMSEAWSFFDALR